MPFLFNTYPCYKPDLNATVGCC